MTQRYVVTGSAGFIGSHLTRSLIQDGAEVLGIDDLSSASPDHSRSLSDPAYNFIRGDVVSGLQEESWPERFRSHRLSGIFHLACPASPADYGARQIATLRTGAAGTDRSLDLATRRGCRAVVTSTSEVYGNPAVHPQVESYWGNVNPIGPRSMYDEAKRFAEALCLAYQRERGTDVGIARLFNTYGPGMRVDDGRLIPTVIAQAGTDEPITVHGDGTQTRSFCYVSDTVLALRRLMESPGLTGPINVGNPDEQTVNDVVRRVLDATRSSSPIRHVARPGDDPDRRLPSIGRAREELGWAPTVAFATGLDLMLARERDLA